MKKFIKAIFLLLFIQAANLFAQPQGYIDVNYRTIPKGESIEFNFVPTVGGTPSSIKWKFESSNKTYTSNLISPSITFNEEGLYNVIAEVENSAGKAVINFKHNVIVTNAEIKFTGNEDNIWTIGHHSYLDFNKPNQQNISQYTRFNAVCGFPSNSMSNSDGDLLFYTHDNLIINRKHQRMTGMFVGYNVNRIVNSFIVPFPGNSIKKYYVFFVYNSPSGAYELYYSIVDMGADNGYGKVESNPLVISGDRNRFDFCNFSVTQHLTVIPDCDNNGYWIIAHEYQNNRFFSYHINSSGVATAPNISTIGPAFSDPENERGVMKASPFGDQIIYCTDVVWNSTQLNYWQFNFDKANGSISGGTNLINGVLQAANLHQRVSIINPYIDFSPNGKYAYITIQRGEVLFQTDLSNNTNIQIVDINNGAYRFNGGLSLGPDGRIYLLTNNGLTATGKYWDCLFKLSVVNNPNLSGASCNYINNPSYLTSTVSDVQLILNQNIGRYVKSHGIQTNRYICIGETIQLHAGSQFTSWTWNNGSTTEYISVSEPGYYSVKVTDQSGCHHTIAIRVLPNPTSFTFKNISNTNENEPIAIKTLASGNKILLAQNGESDFSITWLNDNEDFLAQKSYKPSYSENPKIVVSDMIIDNTTGNIIVLGNDLAVRAGSIGRSFIVEINPISRNIIRSKLIGINGDVNLSYSIVNSPNNTGFTILGEALETYTNEIKEPNTTFTHPLILLYHIDNNFQLVWQKRITPNHPNYDLELGYTHFHSKGTKLMVIDGANNSKEYLLLTKNEVAVNENQNLISDDFFGLILKTDLNGNVIKTNNINSILTSGIDFNSAVQTFDNNNKPNGFIFLGGTATYSEVQNIYSTSQISNPNELWIMTVDNNFSNQKFHRISDSYGFVGLDLVSNSNNKFSILALSKDRNAARYYYHVLEVEKNNSTGFLNLTGSKVFDEILNTKQSHGSDFFSKKLISISSNEIFYFVQNGNNQALIKTNKSSLTNCYTDFGVCFQKINKDFINWTINSITHNNMEISDYLFDEEQLFLEKTISSFQDIILPSNKIYNNRANFNVDFSMEQICEKKGQFFPEFNYVEAEFQWNFGNGIVSVEKTPIFTFPQPGTYTVCLDVKLCGVTSHICKTITIEAKNFYKSVTFCGLNSTIDYTPQCKGSNYTLSSNGEPEFSVSTLPINLGIGSHEFKSYDANGCLICKEIINVERENSIISVSNNIIDVHCGESINPNDYSNCVLATAQTTGNWIDQNTGNIITLNTLVKAPAVLRRELFDNINCVGCIEELVINEIPLQPINIELCFKPGEECITLDINTIGCGKVSPGSNITFSTLNISYLINSNLIKFCKNNLGEFTINYTTEDGCQCIIVVTVIDEPCPIPNSGNNDFELVNEEKTYYNKTSSLKVYPNPSNSIFNVLLSVNTTENQTYKVEVFDLTGKIIYSNSNFNVNIVETIDLKEFATGIYNLKLTDINNKSKNFKLIKY